MIPGMGEHNTPPQGPAPLTADTAANTAAAHAFISRWQHTTASELATAQSFVIELCALLDVDKPHPTPEQHYMFERPVTFSHGDGSSSAGRIDCYKRGHFVLEAKKLKGGAHTKGFDDGLLRARSQGENYARALPAPEGRPPFVLVVDVGTVIEVYAEFSQSGGTYTPFPDPRSHRIKLADLAQPDIRARLRNIWLAPDQLNPARISAQVTREVAQLLAQLAKSLESHSSFKPNQPLAQVQQAPVDPEVIAAYLTRCLFSMFAEDVELLPKGAFVGLLKAHRDDPATLQHMLRILWADMDRGGFSAALAKPVLKFNGKLFKGSAADGYSLLLTPAQVDLLIRAAQANWREVEPAIFGTLLERALDPTERHALGAHYTPRAYVERLVLPTVIAPLRADWANAQAAALVLAREAATLQGKPAADKLLEARAEVKKFHHQLCTTRVLDPACGSGNFLYVTLEHLKRLEGEVLNQLEALGHTQEQLGFEGETVTLQQLRGIEINERAAALAELVLWIGFLQWHIRTQGNAAVAEPVVHDYGNIERRDAVLAWDALVPAYGPNGELLSRWDGTTFKTHPVTGEQVPDDAAQVPQWAYTNARQAPWPQADFIVGNPPFIGASTMRAALGDGYVQALRGAWPGVPESADFVMYWWAHAAALVAHGQARRMGLITTNSLRQTFNRRVVQGALAGDVFGLPAFRTGVDALPAQGVVGAGAGSGGPLILSKAQKSVPAKTGPSAGAVDLVFAIPDHPWVDSANGAAVRIAMTVCERAGGVVAAGRSGEGALLSVGVERTGEFGEVDVTLTERRGVIHADLSVGANVTKAVALRSNDRLCYEGIKPHGMGFLVTNEEATALGFGHVLGLEQHIREYRNGRDLTDVPRGLKIIDAFGLSAQELRERYPTVYQWLLERVKPERDQNNRAIYRDNWWIFGEPRKVLRPGLVALKRYVVTVKTAKHLLFQFLDTSVLPDSKLIAICHDEALILGVLASSLHKAWSLAQGSTLEDRPTYVISRCFETFPFPDDDTSLTPTLRQTIAALAEQIDQHRKRVLAPEAGHAGLTLTGMYNVLAALREGRALNAKEKLQHTQGLVGVLRELHDELDAAVLCAYGLPPGADTDAILTHLVALNTQRAAEEAAGRVRWLRPAFQNSEKSLSKPELPAQVQQGLEMDLADENNDKNDSDLSATAIASSAAATPAPATVQPWPAALPEQVRAVAQVLTSSPVALSLSALEAHFKGRGPWKKGLPMLLQTLEALGRAQQVTVGNAVTWRA